MLFFKAADLPHFKLDNVKNFTGMFYDCKQLEVINLPLCNTENAEITAKMFYGCISLVSLDITNFVLYKTIDMSGMFYNISNTLKESLMKQNKDILKIAFEDNE